MPETWPTISTNYAGIEQVSQRNTIRTPFEAGYVQTRARWTAAKKEFTLSWDTLSDTNHTTLQTFFETTVKGGAESFIWTHPSGTTYTCRFVDDEMKFTSTHRLYWKGSVKIMQV